MLGARVLGAARTLQRRLGLRHGGLLASPASTLQKRAWMPAPRRLSDKTDPKAEATSEEKGEEKGEDKAAEKSGEQGSARANQAPSGPSALQTAASYAWYVLDGVRDAHMQLFGAEKKSVLTRNVEQSASFKRTKKKEEGAEDEDADVDTGPSALATFKGSKNPWDAMRERLKESPLIREMMSSSRKVVDAAASTHIGKQALGVTQSVRDKIEDAREFWETSQNPLVYAVAGAFENFTAETEEGMAVREIKKLDQLFVKEEWEQEIRRNVAPRIIKAHLQGDLKTLKPWLGEAVYNKLAADIRIRKADGLVFDSTIIALDENMMKIKLTEHVGPVILVVYMVQQINCIRNRAGEIVLGAEDEIRAKFYAIAFRQVFSEEESVVRWEIIEYELVGDTPYL